MAVVEKVTPLRPIIAEDDGVREVHGVVLSDSRVVADEHHDMVRLDLGGYSRVTIPPKKARHLAGKLYRLARRIEKRELA